MTGSESGQPMLLWGRSPPWLQDGALAPIHNSISMTEVPALAEGPRHFDRLTRRYTPLAEPPKRVTPPSPAKTHFRSLRQVAPDGATALSSSHEKYR
ncbi:MAG: hypothetical protein ACI9OJ_003917 [Myxococcota bacterium]|jgi:hypothetical protein